MSWLQRAQISPSSKYNAHRVICVATVVLVGLISPPTAWVEMKRWSNQQSNSLSIKAEHACYIRITLSQNIMSTQPKEWSTRRFRKEEVTCTHTGINSTRDCAHTRRTPTRLSSRTRLLSFVSRDDVITVRRPTTRPAQSNITRVRLIRSTTTNVRSVCATRRSRVAFDVALFLQSRIIHPPQRVDFYNTISCLSTRAQKPTFANLIHRTEPWIK